MSGRLSTSRSPVLRAKSLTNLMLSGRGLLSFRNGSSVVWSRARAASSRISETTEGMVYSSSACASSALTGGSFLIIGPESITRLWTGLRGGGEVGWSRDSGGGWRHRRRRRDIVLRC